MSTPTPDKERARHGQTKQFPQKKSPNPTSDVIVPFN